MGEGQCGHAQRIGGSPMAEKRREIRDYLQHAEGFMLGMKGVPYV